MKVLDDGITFPDNTTQTTAATGGSGGGFDGSASPDYTYTVNNGDEGNWVVTINLWISNKMCYMEIAGTGQTYGGDNGGTGTLDVEPRAEMRLKWWSNQDTGSSATINLHTDGTFDIGVNGYGDFGSTAIYQTTMFRIQ